MRSNDPTHLPPEPAGYDFHAEAQREAEADARNDEDWLRERGVYDAPVLASVMVTDAHVSALKAAANGKALDAGQKCELVSLAAQLTGQMRENRQTVARLLSDMGADALVPR